MAKKPDKPELIQTPPERHRPPPQHAGDMPKTCANCQHFEGRHATSREGRCHNGISGRLESRRIDGCAFGFYPSVERYPLRAGPGGVR
jgi:hypothetical protein